MQPSEYSEIVTELPTASLVPSAPMLPFDYDQAAPVLSIVGRRSKRTANRVLKTRPAWSARALSHPLALVAEFHQAFGLPMNAMPTVSLPTDLKQLRVNLIEEEVSELVDATTRNNIIAIADALADVVYVAYGTAVTYGIDLDAVLEEVHRSNMSKLGDDGRPILREDGKVLKSHKYRRPAVAEVLNHQLPLPF